ncbi:hypothetical protein [Euzebyella saccharophila]|uniref:Uncharacterized protein n=1 Tax=Euzebyella saccharophila TaxID=679664 RepID=A0ABV8JQN1_9FLAO|nr:hypothetical protein [Euzebyella saccharophila]
MLKKILISVLLIIIVFVVLVYISLSSTNKEFSTCEILDFAQLEEIDFKEHDSVLVAASTLYKGNPLKHLMQGEQYRKAWETPVKVPIVFLDTLMGGVEILEEGGGQQTHSLKIKIKNGQVYTLRSVTKNPEPLIPEFAKKLGLENIVVDGISAQHPYAALAVAELAKKTGLLSTHPQLLFVPKQQTLDSLNHKFGNRIFLLEHEDKGNAQWTKIKGATEIMDTEDLQELKLEKGRQIQIDENLVVRARLFDLLIGDWDRHTKQWGWVLKTEQDQTLAVPLPCDRDNAFFNIEGVLPSIISQKSITPDLQNFEKEIDYMPGLVMDFDVYFLKTIDANIFEEEAKYLQQQLTEANIKEAFQVWPKAIYDLNAPEIMEKLMARKNRLIEDALKFKQEIDKKEFLNEPLKGSKDLELSSNLLKCFECQ